MAAHSGPAKCPRGHLLQAWEEVAGGLCDGCGKDVRAGDRVMDCRRCNWYLCMGCYWRWGFGQQLPLYATDAYKPLASGLAAEQAPASAAPSFVAGGSSSSSSSRRPHWRHAAEDYEALDDGPDAGEALPARPAKEAADVDGYSRITGDDVGSAGILREAVARRPSALEAVSARLAELRASWPHRRSGQARSVFWGAARTPEAVSLDAFLLDEPGGTSRAPSPGGEGSSGPARAAGQEPVLQDLFQFLGHPPRGQQDLYHFLADGPPEEQQRAGGAGRIARALSLGPQRRSAAGLFVGPRARRSASVHGSPRSDALF